MGLSNAFLEQDFGFGVSNIYYETTSSITQISNNIRINLNWDTICDSIFDIRMPTDFTFSIRAKLRPFKRLYVGELVKRMNRCKV